MFFPHFKWKAIKSPPFPPLLGLKWGAMPGVFSRSGKFVFLNSSEEIIYREPFLNYFPFFYLFSSGLFVSNLGTAPSLFPAHHCPGDPLRPSASTSSKKHLYPPLIFSITKCFYQGKCIASQHRHVHAHLCVSLHTHSGEKAWSHSYRISMEVCWRSLRSLLDWKENCLVTRLSLDLVQSRSIWSVAKYVYTLLAPAEKLARL